ncbi:MAG: tRNA-dihydrouridine synthase [Candidatus Paceibacterota bacterium]|jgi:nifR3 family TIM-barrel protein
MEMGFWKKLPRPFFVLAPMADVTDAAFRRVITEHGKPHVLWTEFVSADGLCSPGRKVLQRDLEYTEGERPIVAQLFSSHPDKMREASRLAAELGFDGIDINMGCPDRSIEKQGAGAAMMKNPRLAREVIRAAKEGVALAAEKMGAKGRIIPVSVKTRIGYNKNEIATWIPEILAEGVAVLTLHCRTRKEMSLVPARWEHVKEVVGIRDRMGVPTLIIGNGDALNLEDARAKAAASGADGVMLGRAIFGNPWLFSELHSKDGKPVVPTLEEKLRVLVDHSKLYEKLLGDIKSFAIMKKHFKAYVHGFDHAKELRVKLMEAESAADLEKTVEGFLGGER